MGRGFQIFIGIDPIVGVRGSGFLSRSLIVELDTRNFWVLSQIWKTSVDGDGCCINDEELLLSSKFVNE